MGRKTRYAPDMEASHRFFRNRACKYFPCHSGVSEETFNCLFCFCPLYFLEECGGDGQVKGGVKDCTSCTIPHGPGGYDRVLLVLREEFARRRRTGGKDESGGEAYKDAPAGGPEG
ncbi:cysteine-rich small domain-containing protein [Fundidesulfovibrio butyratiphilus]